MTTCITVYVTTYVTGTSEASASTDSSLISLSATGCWAAMSITRYGDSEGWRR